MTADAYIVESVRTAGGRRNGRLANWHPADLAAEVLNAVVDRSGIDPAAVEDVILGCVTQAGEQSFAFARNAVLAKLPESVPAVTIDRQCGSSQRSIAKAWTDTPCRVTNGRRRPPGRARFRRKSFR
jgi:acetyl-CoA C-acetyltransferase